MRPLRALSVQVLPLLLAAFPREGVAQTFAPSDSVRRFHVGLTTVGVRHLGVVGLGMFGVYGDWQRSQSMVNWGGEVLLLHSGERRIARSRAHNPAFRSDTLYRSVSYVYEQVSSIGVGGSAFRVLRTPPDELDFVLPGVTLGVSGGVILETDRVGLQSSELDLYYGGGAPSDTDVSFRAYVRPQLMLSQGSVSVVVGMAFLPEFASWSVGVAYGW